MRTIRWLTLCLLALLVLAGVPTTLAADPVIGQPFGVSRLSNNDESRPAIAYNSADGIYLVVWGNNWGGGHQDIYAQRISRTGRLLSWFYVGDGIDPVVAYNSRDNNFLIVWSHYDSINGDYDLYGRRVWAGRTQGTAFPIAGSFDNEIQPAIAFNNHSSRDEFMVVWQNGEHVSPSVQYSIRGQRIAGLAGGGSGGTEAIGNQVELVNWPGTPATSPDIAYNLARNEYGLVYQFGDPFVLPPQPLEVRIWRVTADGVTPPGAMVIVSSNGQAPAIAANNNRNEYVIAYEDHSDANAPSLWAMNLDGDFGGLAQAKLAGDSIWKAMQPDIVRIDHTNDYQVVWTQQGMIYSDVMGMRIDSYLGHDSAYSLSAFPGQFLVSNGQYPAVAAGRGAALAVWEDDGWGTGGWDITGRLLGHQVALPRIGRRFH